MKSINMYKYKKSKPTSISINNSYEGESIEQKMNRVINNKEPINDGAPLVYTDRKEGVMAALDIRTDRWEIAVEAMDVVSKTELAKREERQKTMGEKAKEGMTKEAKSETKNEGGTQSIPGTDSK